MSKYLKSKDIVKVITGNDKGKVGQIIEFDRRNNQVKIDGVNVKTCFNKQTRQGITKINGWINASNVMYLENGQTTKLFVKDGKRYSKNTNQEVIGG